MAFRIPFNEHLIIEADTPADVRALIAEFGISIGGPKLLPAAPTADVDVVEEPRVERRAHQRPAVRRTAPRTPAAAPPPSTGGDAVTDLGARCLKALSDHGALSTGDLTLKARGSSKYTVRVLMDQLATKGIVHSTGTRRSQRWHLGAKGSSSPKEAESRRR